ncbi:DUF3040 domain-containing protein [Paeniglutamicibacter antarcticus]|uniref:DUF3040 domain-containing protein n=1 Tax=Arthrobacter terrae TaxID=2935737 RepID=A0A931CU20_9MICC|nr:DUF3040 domain-containing protein [Arthrobacter terrae]MBG0741409.1 DUF3040 domain-containing protein [Arthrobacter terrae]
MPLSEHEQRLLDQLEQQLHAEDPKFAHTLGSDPANSFSTRHVVIGVLIAIVGIIVLLAGVAWQLIPLGVGGFLIMGAGVYVATLRKGSPRSGAGDSTTGQSKRPKSSFMSSLEERWDERRHGQ